MLYFNQIFLQYRLKATMGQNQSWKTICALVNTMIGGSMLTLPILFRNSGLGIGIITLIVSGWISYKTCSLYSIHMSEKQESIQETIKRLLGKKGEEFFRLITGVYLVFLNIIYVDLIVDQFFGILYFIFHKTDHQDWITTKDEKALVFNKISIQIISLIFSVPLLCTMFIKDLSFLVKLTALGVISVISYVIYIFFKFFQGVSKITPDTAPPLFTSNFGQLVGTCAVAFTIHTVVNPILKDNKFQSNNLRDLKISYICGFFIYSCIGLLGSLAIIGQKCDVTILNCYLNQYKTLVVQIFYFLMLLSVFPCFINVGRTRLLTRLFGDVNQKHVRIFNFIFIFLSTIFSILSPILRLDILMNLVGAFFCFFFIYYIPIKFHWSCLYGKDKQETVSIITSTNELRDSLQDSSDLPDIQIGQKVVCAHDSYYSTKRSKQIRMVTYGFIMLTGVAIGVYGIYDVISQIVDTING